MSDYGSRDSGTGSATRYQFMSAERSKVFCNARAKHFPDGTTQVSAFSADILRVPGWESHGSERRRRSDPDEPTGQSDLERSKRRARAAIADIARSNAFSYFVTLTLDKEKINRYDIVEVTKRLNYWLDNQVRRKGLRYVLVPERHKDGAIHFHGFFNDALKAVDSGTVDIGTGKPRKPRSQRQRASWLADGGHVVYNLPEWSLGFTTAIELYGERRAAIAYVCKYVTKSQEKIGGRWYYSGGDLRRPEITYHTVDYNAFVKRYSLQPYAVEAMGCYGATAELEGDEWQNL